MSKLRVLLAVYKCSMYYASRQSAYNGGGWVDAIIKELHTRGDIELGVALKADGEPFRVEKDGISFYPMPKYQRPPLHKLLNRFGLCCYGVERSSWQPVKDMWGRVIADFKPDVIEIFGSEERDGLLAETTDIPVALHVQGILNPSLNSYFPPGISPHGYYWEDRNPWHAFNRMLSLRWFAVSCMREREIASHIHYYIGRTAWDRAVMNVLNPQAEYFYGGEILREPFYQKHERIFPAKPVFISTISQPMYKGYDLILKTAGMLKHQYQMDFEWRVYGNIDPRVAEKRIKIRHGDVNVRLAGIATAEQLANELSNCTAYMHPSYIDNSPNSLCEAQILGCACVATNVGGVSSLVKDGETGFLIPANDPYQAAYRLRQLSLNHELNRKLGEQAQKVATRRHDRKEIVEGLVRIFREISGNNNIQRESQK